MRPRAASHIAVAGARPLELPWPAPANPSPNARWLPITPVAPAPGEFNPLRLTAAARGA